MEQKREKWGSKFGFILAASGSAVGLGNIWKFPYIAGENGGAAFILVYLISILLIGIPVFISELIIGRKSQLNVVGAFKKLSDNSPLYSAVGYMGILTAFVILSYYNVVAGWSLGYFFEAIKGTFNDFSSVEIASEYFGNHIANTKWIISWQFIFILLSVYVVFSGVRKGIEKYSKLLMPILIVILIFLAIWGSFLKGGSAGLSFLFKPDWSSINGKVILIALGHAFFTLSLGMGAIITYGSYFKKEDNILTNALWVVFLDTFIAIVAGIAIFTSVFSMGFAPDSGPGLIFNILPAVFNKMPAGNIFGGLFFMLLFIAALTSAVSLLEVITSYFVDTKKYSRHWVVVISAFVTFLVGIPSAMSFGLLKDFQLFGKTFFDIMDFLSANILLPAGGLFIAIFIGWKFGKKRSMEALESGSNGWFHANIFLAFIGKKVPAEKMSIGNVWFVFIRFIAPVLILLVFLKSIGII
ncbi:MAG: sodium-dependent transporter [Candidatus Marinimicrobia bacterium]|nr:sodium-dependent transporter [Candidatus Neomarinimicrobiota bacterium]